MWTATPIHPEPAACDNAEPYYTKGVATKGDSDCSAAGSSLGTTQRQDSAATAGPPPAEPLRDELEGMLRRAHDAPGLAATYALCREALGQARSDQLEAHISQHGLTLLSGSVKACSTALFLVSGPFNFFFVCRAFANRPAQPSGNPFFWDITGLQYTVAVFEFGALLCVWAVVLLTLVADFTALAQQRRADTAPVDTTQAPRRRSRVPCAAELAWRCLPLCEALQASALTLIWFMTPWFATGMVTSLLGSLKPLEVLPRKITDKVPFLPNAFTACFAVAFALAYLLYVAIALAALLVKVSTVAAVSTTPIHEWTLQDAASFAQFLLNILSLIPSPEPFALDTLSRFVVCRGGSSGDVLRRMVFTNAVKCHGLWRGVIIEHTWDCGQTLAALAAPEAAAAPDAAAGSEEQQQADVCVAGPADLRGAPRLTGEAAGRGELD